MTWPFMTVDIYTIVVNVFGCSVGSDAAHHKIREIPGIVALRGFSEILKFYIFIMDVSFVLRVTSQSGQFNQLTMNRIY